MKMVNLNPDDDVWEIGFGDYCANKKNRFTDSGLAALDAHKEELYLAVDEYFELNGTDRRLRVIAILDKIKKEVNQIEKEK